jgi:hypothetical protein
MVKREWFDGGGTGRQKLKAEMLKAEISHLETGHRRAGGAGFRCSAFQISASCFSSLNPGKFSQKMKAKIKVNQGESR